VTKKKVFVDARSGCNIQGSLVCDDVTIEQRADIKDSIAGQRQVVPAEGLIPLS
jgi:NDP-sugar pyrophosphorylase family protein